jgi:folate-binding Fe-S cluster repair protein YgfZ
VLRLDDPPADGAEVFHGGKVVGRVTSAVPGLALAYVRVEVPEDAELTVEGRAATQLH